MISVLTPSRGRPASLRKSMDSIFSTANSPENVEFLVALDPDEDMPSYGDVLSDLPALYSYRCIQAPQRYGYRGMAQYLNLLAANAQGDWFLNWNDDAVMLSPGWDATLLSLSSSILVAGLQDNYPGGLVCFPAVRREAVERLGKFCEDTPHVDTWWQDIGHKSDSMQIVDVHVRHDRFDLTGEHMDSTWTEGRSGLRSQEFYDHHIQGLLHDAVNKLRELL